MLPLLLTHCTRGMPYQKMESQCIEYRAYVRRRPTIKCWYAAQPAGCTDATRTLEVELDPGCDRTRPRPWHPLIQAGLFVSVSLDSLVCVSIKFGGRNISIATLLSPRHLQLSLLETSTRFVLHLYRGFLKLFHSCRTQCVKAFSTDGKHGAGHFHR